MEVTYCKEWRTPPGCGILLKPVAIIGWYIPNRQAWVQHTMGTPLTITLSDSLKSGDSCLEDFCFLSLKL